MFKITSVSINISCDNCGIILDDTLTIEDINNAKNRYHLCNECESKIRANGEIVEIQPK